VQPCLHQCPRDENTVLKILDNSVNKGPEVWYLLTGLLRLSIFSESSSSLRRISLTLGSIGLTVDERVSIFVMIVAA
jgi:hypothetical protein